MSTTSQNRVGIWFYFMFTVSNEHTVRYIVLPIPKFREWINCVQIGGWCQYDCIIFPPSYSSDPNAIFIIPIDSTWITHFGEIYTLSAAYWNENIPIFFIPVYFLCVNVFLVLAGSPFHKVLLFWIKWTWDEHEEIKSGEKITILLGLIGFDAGSQRAAGNYHTCSLRTALIYLYSPGASSFLKGSKCQSQHTLHQNEMKSILLLLPEGLNQEIRQEKRGTVWRSFFSLFSFLLAPVRKKE